nr:le16 gene [Solanum lycopersicum]
MEMFGKIACFVVFCMVVVAPHAESLSCGEVTSGLAPCLPYLEGRGPLGGCCGGVKGLLGARRPQKTGRQRALALNRQLILLRALIQEKPLGSLEFVESTFLTRSALPLIAQRSSKVDES